VEDNIQETLNTGNFHIDFIQFSIFGFVYDIISFVVFCFRFLFAIGYFLNAVVGPWGMPVMYLKSYQEFKKKKSLINGRRREGRKKPRGSLDKRESGTSPKFGATW